MNTHRSPHPRLHITTRRAALSTLSLALSPLVGCASSTPKRGLSSLPAKAIALLEPRCDSTLKLKVTDWARPISATNLRGEELAINSLMGLSSSGITGRFSEALAGELRENGFDVDQVVQNYAATTPGNAKHAASIRSFLTAGFVYKTFTSATYAPFVQVVLEANLSDGRAIYHQLYSATDRSLNLFITNFPASTHYVFAEIEALQSQRDQALEALSTLAAQLGKVFASELTASRHDA